MNRCKSRLTLNGSTLSTLTTCYWKATIPGSQTLCGKIVFQGLTGGHHSKTSLYHTIAESLEFAESWKTPADDDETRDTLWNGL